MVIQKNATQSETSPSNNPNLEAIPNNAWTAQGPKTLSIRMNTSMQTVSNSFKIIYCGFLHNYV